MGEKWREIPTHELHEHWLYNVHFTFSHGRSKKGVCPFVWPLEMG